MNVDRLSKQELLRECSVRKIVTYNRPVSSIRRDLKDKLEQEIKSALSPLAMSASEELKTCSVNILQVLNMLDDPDKLTEAMSICGDTYQRYQTIDKTRFRSLSFYDRVGQDIVSATKRIGRVRCRN